jgi:hypothetical protein
MPQKDAPLRFGKLQPLYRFILNPHKDLRCSTCPECSRKTLIRKVPLVVSVLPDRFATINKHCRYCSSCDILIAHQDELEHMLAVTFDKHAPEVVGNEYFALGSLEPAAWRTGKKKPFGIRDLQEYVHDFKERLDLEYVPAHWGPADEEFPSLSKKEADKRRESETLPTVISSRKRHRKKT